MASFDIVSKVEIQSLDNAINSAKREINNRYDFKGSKSSIELDKKSILLHVITENDMLMEQIRKVIISRLIRQNIDAGCLDFAKELYAAGNMLKKDITIRQGIDKEIAKKIVKSIKSTKLKVQPSIMDEQIRISSKKIDDLQKVITHCKKNDFGLPLQYINFK